MNAKTIFLLSCLFGLGLTLLILARACFSSCPVAHFLLQSCALPYDSAGHTNAWPLLIGAVYLLLPMPIIFLKNNVEDSSMGGSSWVDTSKFITGLTAALVIGLPLVLTHAEFIHPLQLAYALPAAFVLASTAIVYDLLEKRESSYDSYESFAF
jgi:hypothetical protein